MHLAVVLRLVPSNIIESVLLITTMPQVSVSYYGDGL